MLWTIYYIYFYSALTHSQSLVAATVVATIAPCIHMITCLLWCRYRWLVLALKAQEWETSEHSEPYAPYEHSGRCELCPDGKAWRFVGLLILPLSYVLSKRFPLTASIVWSTLGRVGATMRVWHKTMLQAERSKIQTDRTTLSVLKITLRTARVDGLLCI